MEELHDHISPPTNPLDNETLEDNRLLAFDLYYKTTLMASMTPHRSYTIQELDDITGLIDDTQYFVDQLMNENLIHRLGYTEINLSKHQSAEPTNYRYQIKSIGSKHIDKLRQHLRFPQEEVALMP